MLKLGIRVSAWTVRKYMPKRPPGRARDDQRWSSFLRNHAKAIVACDFSVAVTATFRQLYVFVMIEHGSRRLLHVNVTAHRVPPGPYRILPFIFHIFDAHVHQSCGGCVTMSEWYR
jgi:hypothetical protein